MDIESEVSFQFSSTDNGVNKAVVAQTTDPTTIHTLAGILPMFRDFLTAIGFTYVDDVVVVTNDGTIHRAN